MNDDEIEALLRAVERGETSARDAATRLRAVGNLGFARVDHRREARCGFPEVVYCASKTAEESAAIAAEVTARSDRLLMTRADAATFAAVHDAVKDAVYHERARAITCVRGAPVETTGLVAILTAGTSDIPVAEEARVTAEMMGARVETRFDVGVAGLHRLLAEQALIQAARVLIVLAGMEAALASVVGGLVARPVIAVPTSVGYGASFQGVTALLGMLNSCAPTVTVVNVDNGFGAGYVAALINRDPDS